MNDFVTTLDAGAEMGDEVTPREFVQLQVKFDALSRAFEEHKQESRASMAESNRKIDELLAMANRSKGAIWMGMGLASTLGAIAAFIVSHFWPR